MSDEAPANNGTYQLITPPNLLKVKVGNSDGSGGIDHAAIAQATSALESLAEDFSERVTIETAMIMKLASDLDASPDKAERIAKKVRDIAFEVGGLGETFGYELISEIGASLKRYTLDVRQEKRLSGDVFRAHAEAMRAVIKNQIRGTGGVVGSELVKSLDELVDRMI